jgi:hypothetical protein
VIFFGENPVSLFVIVKVFFFFDTVLIHGLNVNGRKFYLCLMIIIARSLLKNTKISAIALFPVVLVRSSALRENAVLINHEKIHLRQQLEMLVIFFYLWYVIEYYYLFFKLKDPYQAYKSISFEREAYAMENNPDYLKTRKFWSFWKYRY